MSEALQFEWSTLSKLLPLCIDFVQQKHEGEPVDFREAVDQIGKELGFDDVDKHAAEQFKRLMEEGLGLGFDEEQAGVIAEIFANSSKPVMTAIIRFSQGETCDKDLVEALNEVFFGSTTELQAALQKSLGIPDSLAEAISNKLGSYTVSVYCFASAFKIYQTAAHDARIAKEHRVEVERLANESIAQLQAERAQMDAVLSDWMLDRIEPFSQGVTAMDRAILEDDDDAFIEANADLWRLLGREAAYSNAAEFDELMLSDNVFKL